MSYPLLVGVTLSIDELQPSNMAYTDLANWVCIPPSLEFLEPMLWPPGLFPFL